MRGHTGPPGQTRGLTGSPRNDADYTPGRRAPIEQGSAAFGAG